MGKNHSENIHIKRELFASDTPDEGTQVRVQRKHKDTLFRFLFRDKGKLLQLYNAINNTDYQDVESITVTTLENILYLGYKNDVSFLLDLQLCLYEQQSTWNPNTPLRGILYFARLYRAHIAQNSLDLYGTKRLELPFPRYVVFYNGKKERPERETLLLSDSFQSAEHDSEEDRFPALECRVLVLNINYGKNRELMEKCRPLLDYARFIYYIREGIDEGVDAERAVENAVERCLKEDVLTDVLVAHRKEVVGMFLEEYDEELHFQTLRREGYEDGHADGMEKGLTLGKSEGEARVQLLYQKLLEDQRMDDLYRAAKDKEFMELLFKEYEM
jgi:hypothetical protein